jgi:hypothetical protein
MRRFALILGLAAAWPAARAAAADVPTAAAPGDVSDQSLEDLKTKTKDALAKKVSEIEKAHAEREAFAKALKDDRVAFEKKASGDLVVFLTDLKKAPMPDRRKAFAVFADKQRVERDEFNRQSRVKIEEFRRKNLESN